MLRDGRTAYRLLNFRRRVGTDEQHAPETDAHIVVGADAAAETYRQEHLWVNSRDGSNFNVLPLPRALRDDVVGYRL